MSFNPFDHLRRKTSEAHQAYCHGVDAEDALLSPEVPVIRKVIAALCLLFFTMMIWASWASIDERTFAEGKVIPSSQLKYIQSLEGGIIEKIYVREGQKVKQGDTVVKIDDTGFTSNYGETRAKIIALRASIARLESELRKDDHIIFPEDFEKKHPSESESEKSFFMSRKQKTEAKVLILKKALEISQNEHAMTKPLVEKGVMSKIELLRLEREINDKKGALEDYLKTLSEETEKELNQKMSDLSVLEQSLTAARDRMARTTLKSPVNGTVKKLYVSTLGQVVKTGENIVEIVPDEDTLLIQARVQPSDIGFLHPGQTANVKITAYDFSIYGGLEGKVEYISADSLVDEKGNAYYEILVRTEKNHLGNEKNHLEIMAGMTADVQILTGRKTVMYHLLKPILKAKERALRER